jgi:hypothetical protein
MAAGTYNLTGSNAIERGACYSYSIDLSTTTGEYTLSGYAVSGYLRRKWDGSFGPDWTSSILSTGSGIITLSLDAAKTSELSYDSYEQEIFIYPPNSGCPVRIIKGDVDIQGGGFE